MWCGGNKREVGRAGGQAGVGGKGRELYLNNNKIRGGGEQERNQRAWRDNLASLGGFISDIIDRFYSSRP